MLASGEILAGFCTKNLPGLFLTEGVMMGIGVSLSYIVVGSNPAQYFYRRRGIANGIVFACGGLGGAVISFLMQALIDKLGTAWTLRVLGFLTLATGLPACWFIRDRVPPSRRTFVDWQLFKDLRFVLLFCAGGVATFPLLVRKAWVERSVLFGARVSRRELQVRWPSTVGRHSPRAGCMSRTL